MFVYGPECFSVLAQLVIEGNKLTKLKKNRGPWATMAHLSEQLEKLNFQHVRLSVSMATNQNEEFVQHLYASWRTIQQTILKRFCQNTYNKTAIKANFYFSHYKYMETRKLQPKCIFNINKIKKKTFL